MIFDRHQKSIIWEKWRDPFLGYDDNEIDLDNIDQINTQYDDEETGEPIFKKTGPPIRVMATPMGLIPYNEYTASSKIFNFWIGHTNFTISKKIADIIETTDGIETLDVFTRYRFRIGVGKAFEDGEIMRFIEERIIKNE
jgi:hypothetical protein